MLEGGFDVTVFALDSVDFTVAESDVGGAGGLLNEHKGSDLPTRALAVLVQRAPREATAGIKSVLVGAAQIRSRIDGWRGRLQGEVGSGGVGEQGIGVLAIRLCTRGFPGPCVSHVL